ncbi:MAG TPA: hypothetical protein VF796_16580 [Humisphaera sp.]
MTRPLPLRVRRLLPVALIALGLWLLVGCVYLPLPKSLERPGTADPKALVGERGSNRPVEPGVSRATVLRALGEPARQSADGRVLGYVVRYKTGVWIFPLCFSGVRARSDLAVRLEFDANGALRRYAFKEADAPPQLMSSNNDPFPAREVDDFLDSIGLDPRRQPLPAPPTPDAALPPEVTQPSPATRPAVPGDPAVPDGRPYETR